MDVDSDETTWNGQSTKRSSGVSSSPSVPMTPPTPDTKEWRYEMRREAQEIISGLYLGPFQSSTNMARLNNLGITHILCIRDQRESSLIYARFPTEFRYLTLDITDKDDQNIISIFPACKGFIEEGLSCDGKVLVHDNGGIAAAPAIVIGYLMWKYGWTAEHAQSFVQAKRYCISPVSFVTQLREYEPITAAQKLMESQGSYSGLQSPLKRVHLGQDEGEEDEDGYRRRKTHPLEFSPPVS